MKINSIAPSVLFGFSLAALPAGAATIFQSFSFGSPTPLDSGVPFSGVLDYFDSNLGTLNSVEMRLTLNTFGGSGFGTSGGAAATQTMDFNSNVTVTLQNPAVGGGGGPDPVLIDTSFSPMTLTATDTIEDVEVPGGGGSSATVFFDDQSADSGLKTAIAPGSFVNAGGGSFTVNPATSPSGAGRSSFTTSGGSVKTATYNSPDYSGTFELVYNYTANSVPEIPETSGAFAAVLLCGLMVGRRNRR